jgi:tetratricopeptide (TPR) repeat protein
MSKQIFNIVCAITVLAVLGVNTRADEINDALARGHEAFQRGQFEQASFEYSAALQWPGAHQAQAHFNIGVCQHRRGRLQAAAVQYRAALKLRNNQYPAASYALGLVLRDTREEHAAREAFAQAVTTSGGKHAPALFELGLAAQQAGDDQAAIDYYQKALAQERMPAGHNNLGVILARRGQLDEAIQEFETALARSRGQFAEAQANLLLCHQVRVQASARMIAQLQLSGTTTTIRSE